MFDNFTYNQERQTQDKNKMDSWKDKKKIIFLNTKYGIYTFVDFVQFLKTRKSSLNINDL